MPLRNWVRFPLFLNLETARRGFVAEIRLRKLVSGFLREQADPHLDKGVGRLKQIEALLGNLDLMILGKREPEGMRFYRVGTGK